MQLTDKIRYALFGAALEEDDRLVYISDWALSSVWGSLAETEDLAELARVCERIWDISKMSIKDIRQMSGLTQAEFSKRFLIPVRTIQNWESRGGCPDYVRIMLARLCGLADGIFEE